MKHTKGPWAYNDRLAEDGDKETAVYGHSKHLSEPVCVIPHDDITENGYKEVKANARLIAAAPQLLAVCKRAKELLVPEVTKEPDRTIFWELVAAIEKAEGKS